MSPRTKKSIRIVILDNQDLCRAGLRLLIDSKPGMSIVGEAGSLRKGLEIVANLKPDIILIELNLSGMSGLNIVPSILKAYKRARLILVTSSSDPQVHQSAVESGVMGIVSKSQKPEILINAIEKVYAGEVWLERSMIAYVLSRLSRDHNLEQTSQVIENINELSEREKEVIQLIGQAYNNNKISTELCISEATVRHHLTSIYRKLGVSNRLELLVYAHHYDLVKRPNN